MGRPAGVRPGSSTATSAAAGNGASAISASAAAAGRSVLTYFLEQPLRADVQPMVGPAASVYGVPPVTAIVSVIGSVVYFFVHAWRAPSESLSFAAHTSLYVFVPSW